MKEFDLVELILEDEKTRSIGLKAHCLGTILKVKNDVADVIFFNDKNMGDYVLANLDTSKLKKIGEVSQEKREEINKFISNLDLTKHAKIDTPKIQEYDLVELNVEDKKYTKYGVHIGQRGCVVSNYAIQNKVEVDFTEIDSSGNLVGATIVVNIEDLKIIE